jgi:hypothetical protein
VECILIVDKTVKILNKIINLKFNVLGPMLPVYDGRENLYTPEPVPAIPELAQADLGNHL